jgi:hypothetical protein
MGRIFTDREIGLMAACRSDHSKEMERGPRFRGTRMGRIAADSEIVEKKKKEWIQAIRPL